MFEFLFYKDSSSFSFKEKTEMRRFFGRVFFLFLTSFRYYDIIMKRNQGKVITAMEEKLRKNGKAKAVSFC
jgi:hypothetical protein